MSGCFIYLKLISVTKYDLKHAPQRPFFVGTISYAIRYSHRAHISTKKLKHERSLDGDLKGNRKIGYLKENRKIGLSKKDWVISSVIFPIKLF